MIKATKTAEQNGRTLEQVSLFEVGSRNHRNNGSQSSNRTAGKKVLNQRSAGSAAKAAANGSAPVPSTT